MNSREIRVDLVGRRQSLVVLLMVLSLSPAVGQETAADGDGSAVQPKSPEEALAGMQVPDGFRVELVAAEPLVMVPVAFAWGTDGRLWVVGMAD